MSDEAKDAGGQIAKSLRNRMAMAQRNRQAKRGDNLADAGSAPEDAVEIINDESAILPDETDAPEAAPEISDLETIEPEEEILFCTACAAEPAAEQSDTFDPDSAELEPAGVIAEHTCLGCKTALCADHVYREENGTLTFCYACADEKVGICADCGVLHARPCRECSKKVCDDCAKKVIERWGWGGDPGQGGVTSWFPFVRTYCQEHGSGRVDRARPAQRNFVGYDGSSPEW